MTTLRERPDVPVAPARPLLRSSARHVAIFVALLLVYAAYTYAVIERSPVGRFDRYVYTLHFRRDILTTFQYDFLLKYVYLGQRGFATFVFLPYFIWTALRLRSARPMVMLVVALILLNVSVGLVKIITGRIGPRETVHYFDVLMGGNIYPSGHVSNAVVLYGLMAWISLRHRKLFTVLAIWVSVTVGVGAVMVNTHWFSDIVGGWMAGGLVLLALPWFVPPAERAFAKLYYRRIKHHTDPWVVRLQQRWPRLREIGPSPILPVSERFDRGQLDGTAP